MPSSLPSRRSFSDFVDSLNPTGLRLIKEGVPVLNNLPQEKFAILAKMAAQTAFTPHELGAMDAENKLGLAEDDALNALGLASLLSVATEFEETPRQIAELLTQKFKLNESESAALGAFLDELQRKDTEVATLRSQNRLAVSVLPAFEILEIAVDIRFATEDEKLSTYVPVAIAYLKTDAAQQRLWFQITKIQLRNLIRKLEKTLLAMEKAEAWVRKDA